MPIFISCCSNTLGFVVRSKPETFCLIKIHSFTFLKYAFIPYLFAYTKTTSYRYFIDVEDAGRLDCRNMNLYAKFISAFGGKIINMFRIKQEKEERERKYGIQRRKRNREENDTKGRKK